ncbi:MAG TPA: DUF4115 domain-containing protein [Melioribacteraceae bacterium]|nr:DUF4115 domain-containing protein [Melioribacteraceae bacterium]
MNEALKKFATELKTSREAKEISLNYIASRTKIDIRFLQAIEEGNFDLLPEIYMRAFIREYAQFSEIDVKEVLKKFDLAKRGLLEENSSQEKEPDESSAAEQTMSEKVETKPAQKIMEETEPDSKEPADHQVTAEIPPKKIEIKNLYVLSFSVLVIMLLIAYFIFFNGPSKEIIADIPDQDRIEQSGERFELEATPQANEYMPEDDSLKLDLTGLGRVWVKVQSDSRIIFQGFLLEKQNSSFKALNEFRVSVGNAGLISMDLNGKQLQIPGARGEIRNYIINSDTVKSYILSVPSKNETGSPN